MPLNSKTILKVWNISGYNKSNQLFTAKNHWSNSLYPTSVIVTFLISGGEVFGMKWSIKSLDLVKDFSLSEVKDSMADS